MTADLIARAPAEAKPDPRVLLHGRHLTYWRLDNRHIEPLQRIISSPDVSTMWRSRGAYWAPYQIQAQLTRDVLQSAVATVGSDPDDEIAGLVEVLDPSLLDRRAQLSALVAPRYLSTGLGIEMVLEFADFVFDSYGIEKLQIETHSVNHRLVPGLHRFLSHEGTFRRHLNIDGAWHDVEIFALWRSDMDRLRRILGRIQE